VKIENLKIILPLITLTFYFLVRFFYNNFMGKHHGRMARGGQELPKVSQGLVMPVHHRNSLMAILGVAHPQGERPATIFYPFGHPIPYAYGNGNT
jgi:hypothetical protein